MERAFPDSAVAPRPQADLDDAATEARDARVTAMLTAQPANPDSDDIDWDDMAARHPGLMPFPSDKPVALVTLSVAIPQEARRLLDLAETEYERRRQAYVGHPDASVWPRVAAGLRREMRMDALAAAAVLDLDTAEPEPLSALSVGMVQTKLPAFSATVAASDPDALLVELEAEFLAKEAATVLAYSMEADALNIYNQPEMPIALRVWRNDWVYNSIPRPAIQTFSDGSCRTLPYGKKETEILRANPCMALYVGGGDGELMPDGHCRRRPDVQAQKRADAIVAAWDEWQAQIVTAREKANLPNLEATVLAAREARDAVLQRARETPACGLTGLAIKARIAANMLCEHDIQTTGLEYFEPDDGDAFLYSLAGDVLALTGGLPAAHQ